MVGKRLPQCIVTQQHPHPEEDTNPWIPKFQRQDKGCKGMENMGSRMEEVSIDEGKYISKCWRARTWCQDTEYNPRTYGSAGKTKK